MAEPLDVDARLAEGRPAVDTVGEYVWACHLLGYQNPDLTVHPAQVRDWYSSEDGLDLRALEADRAALESVAVARQTAFFFRRGTAQFVHQILEEFILDFAQVMYPAIFGAIVQGK